MDLFQARRLPFMSRRNYVLEMQHVIFWGIFAGLVEGTVAAVVASKTFNGSLLLITVVQATPAFANLSSLLWGALIVGRRKLPLFMALGAAALASTLAVAAVPHNDWWGGWLFALQICLGRVFMSGVVTIRASFWKNNYSKTHRGRITARLQIVRTLLSIPVILGGSLLFDWDESAYRWFYPAVAVVGAFGLWIMRRGHIRGEKTALARHGRTGDGEPIADAGLVAPFSLVALLSPGHVIRRMRDVLRADPRFARYCQAQMCIGSANLMVAPVNTIILTKVLGLGYFSSNFLLDLTPRVVTLVMLPIWARLFDRVGVLRFRVVNSACWCGSLLFCGLGAMFAHRQALGLEAGVALTMLAYHIGRVIEGFAQSGGAIAWNIGHLHFAEDDKAELYMGIHVSLTGLRGLITPFLGTLLYQWIDWGVFAVGFAISAVGMYIFAALAREERRSATPRG